MDELQSGKDTETSNARPDRMQAVLHFVIGFLFFMGSVMLLGGIAVALLSFYYYGDASGLNDSQALMSKLYPQNLMLKIFLFFSSSLPLLAAAFISLRFIKASPRDFLMLNRPQSKKWFLYSLLFVLVSMPLMSSLLELNMAIDLSKWPDLKNWIDTQDSASNQTYEAMVGNRGFFSLVTSLLFIALIPAIAEEIFFRGFLMTIFNGIFKNMHVSIFVTALLFSVIHFQLLKVIPMFFLATVFGYAVYWTGSLWASIIAHFVNNAIAVIMLYYYAEGDYGKVLEQGESLPLAATMLMAIIVVIFFIYIQKNSSTKTRNFYV